MPLPEAAGAQYGQNRTRNRDEHVRKPLSRPLSCLIWYFHLFRRRAGKAAETENPKTTWTLRQAQIRPIWAFCVTNESSCAGTQTRKKHTETHKKTQETKIELSRVTLPKA